MSTATIHRYGIFEKDHELHRAFMAWCKRRGIDEPEAVDANEFQSYMRSKTEAGRRAEIEDAKGVSQ